MSAEQIMKLQPNRTIALKGFDRRGAAAALHSATTTGFQVSGVLRDFADFAVVDLWDADNPYEHFTMRYLPDFDFTNMVLEFDLHYDGLQPIDSPKNPWIAWHGLSAIVVNPDGSETGAVIPFSECAMLQAGTFSPASATWEVYGAAGAGDRIAWFYLDHVFEVTWTGPFSANYLFYWQNDPTYNHYVRVQSGAFDQTYAVLESIALNGTGAASSIAYQINADTACPLEAVWDTANGITLQPRSLDRAMVSLTASDGNAGATVENIGLTPASIAVEVARQINRYNWPLAQPAIAIMAEASGDDLTITAARYGRVDVAGTAVTWAWGDRFGGIAPGSTVWINETAYTVSTVDSQIGLTLTASAGTLTDARYLAERGGRDGNLIQVQCRAFGGVATTGNSLNVQIRHHNQMLSGGSSDVTWRITVPFTEMAASKLRKLWMTLAPALADGAYGDTEFTATISNWTVTDPDGHRPLKVAGPGSVRLGSRDDWAKYQGGPWSEWVTGVTPGSNWYYRGAARATGAAGAMVNLQYTCQHTHNLYLGTDLFTDRGIVAVTVDGVPAATIDTYLATDAPIATRRLIQAAVSPGSHVVRVVNTGTKNAASSGWNAIFDYLDAAVLSDVPDPVAVTITASPAIDWDTDHTYKLPPARLTWNLDRLGLRGDINEYIGVFWWAQRKRVAGTARRWDVELSGTWPVGSAITLTVSGIAVTKTVTGLDAGDGDAACMTVIAQSVADGINTTFVGVWAEVTGALLNVITVRPRTAMFWFTRDVLVSSTGSASATATGSLDPGSEGVWEIDLAQTPALNKAARDWHADLFADVQARGWTLTLAYSMELLNPPEDPGAGKHFAARYASGLQVLTSTGFGTEAQATITDVTPGTPPTIEASGHGYNTGDDITVSGVVGVTGVNGRHTVTRLNADEYTLDGVTASGTFAAWTAVSGLPVPGSVRHLRTTHCTFSPSMSDYQKDVYAYSAGLMDAAGLTPWLQFGEFLWWFFSRTAASVENATATTPIQIAWTGHGLSTGQTAIVTGVRGLSGANGTWPVSVTGANTFTLDGSIGSGVYVPGTGSLRTGGMGYYDGATAAAAVTSLGRVLATFHTQDDSPAINGGADVALLAALLQTHVDAIRVHVLSSYAGAKFEWLHAMDVNAATCYHTLDFPYPQGGRLNHAVNIPPSWTVKAGSGLDRIKMESLSWGATYRNIDQAKAAISWPYTVPQGWPLADCRYLIPVFNGGCPWQQEYRHCLKDAVPHVNFWAWDHISLLSLPLPLPILRGNARLT